MTSPSSSPNLLTAAYSVPSLYANNVHATWINGLVRLTFFEQCATYREDGGTGEIISCPRAAITLTADTAREVMEMLQRVFEKPSAGALQ